MCKFRVIASLLFRRSNLFDIQRIASSQKTLLAMTPKKTYSSRKLKILKHADLPNKKSADKFGNRGIT